MARLLIPSLRSCFISGTSLPAVIAAHAVSRLSGLVDSCLHPVPQNIPFEFREHGQHACESAAARGGEIERFAQRNEADVERPEGESAREHPSSCSH